MVIVKGDLMKVLCVGESTYDISVNTNYFPLENSLNIFNERIETAGGLIPNIAYFLGKSNVEVYNASMVGNDDYGTFIKKELELAHVKTDFIETSYQDKTNINFVLYNSTNKSNTIYSLNNKLSLKKYSFNINPDLLIVDGTEYSASLSALERFKETISILVIKSPTNENLDLAKYSKVIIISNEAAEKITNLKINYNDSNTIVNLYNNLKTIYNNSEIILNISMYGVVYAINDEIKIIPAINSIERVDMNCEIEGFIGGYVYGLANNIDKENSLIFGLITSSLTTSKIGLRNSLPKIEDVINYYNQKFNINPNINQVNTEMKEVPNNDNTKNSQA